MAESGIVDDARIRDVEVSQNGDRREIAVLEREGRHPGVFWLGGYASEMTGTKASFLNRQAVSMGLNCLRFDYTGVGRSSGSFEQATVSHWLSDAKAVYRKFARGKQILVGSSMGAWIACLLALELRRNHVTDPHEQTVEAMILIAPALDMTRDLMLNRADVEERERLKRDGFVRIPAGSEDGLVITASLIEDGAKHLLLDKPVELPCPVTIIQGMKDTEVPWEHALRTFQWLDSNDSVFVAIKDADHRLSRPGDLERIGQILREYVVSADD